MADVEMKCYKQPELLSICLCYSPHNFENSGGSSTLGERHGFSLSGFLELECLKR